MKRNRKGFTLIELLIVVAIIGIIVAIAIPNLLNAIQRAKQKRTMGDMRSIATAAESYSIDWNYYPQVTFGALSTYLSPTYIRQLPARDGWNTAFSYTAVAAQDYTIISYGKDQATGPTGTGAFTNFNCDIIFSNGQFVYYPEGSQN